MGAEYIPTSGYAQPRKEFVPRVAWLQGPPIWKPVTERKQARRGPRPPSLPAVRLRRVLAENVQFLLDRHYPLSKYRIKSKQQQQLAKDAGVSWSSIQRMLDPEDGKAIDTIADIAVAVHIHPAELLRSDLPERLPDHKPPETTEPHEPQPTRELRRRRG